MTLIQEEKEDLRRHADGVRLCKTNAGETSAENFID